MPEHGWIVEARVSEVVEIGAGEIGDVARELEREVDDGVRDGIGGTCLDPLVRSVKANIRQRIPDRLPPVGEDALDEDLCRVVPTQALQHVQH